MNEEDPMLEAAPLVYLFVYVSDLERSRRFYEEALGLQVVEEDADSVKYDTGRTMLALNRAADFGVRIERPKDYTSLIVLHVDDLDATLAGLRERGVEHDDPLRYEIGATSDVFDPDGHCISLYEPSPEAMTWASADSIRAVLETSASRSAGVDAASAGPLAHRPLAYLFFFVGDAERTADFYQGKLGLRPAEVDEGAGVVKYDCGGTLLATHPPVGPPEHALARPKSIAAVFAVADLDAAYAELTGRDVAFAGAPARSAIGATVRFEDPDGHVFYLYEPSEEALGWPSGEILRDTLSRAGGVPS